jgi:predicted transcriptional regulator
MLLLSIHPRYVDAILVGDKRFELRRRKPSVEKGAGLIYSTSPRMELAATFQVAAVTRAPLVMLWQLVRESAGVSRREFDAYFQGCDTGVAIQLSDVLRLSNPIPLQALRQHWCGFQPPQGFRYLDAGEVARVFDAESRRKARRAA